MGKQDLKWIIISNLAFPLIWESISSFKFLILLFWTIFFFKENCSTYKIIYEKLFYMNEHLYATWLTSSLKRCFLRMWDYKAGIGQEGVTSRVRNRMFVWLKHETGLISSTTVFEKDKKEEKRGKGRKAQRCVEKSRILWPWGWW